MTDTRLQRSLRVTFLGMAANMVLAGGKLFAGLVGHSHALVADACESFADIVGSIIVWRGIVVASKPADADHPYGHGKAEPIAAAVISTMLLLAAAGIGLHALREVITPTPGPGPRPFTLLVLIAVLVVKEVLFRYVQREGEAVQSAAVKSDAWHHRSDAVTSLAAAIGITISLVGGPRFASADSVAAVVAAAVIAWNGWSLLRPALEELMDATPDPLLTERIRVIASAVPGVDAIEKCFARKMGYHLFVDMHVHVDPQMTVERSHRLAHEVKDTVRAQLPHVHDVLIHIEPARPAA